MEPDAHGPGIKIPPPVIYFAALILGLALDYLWTAAPLPDLWGYVTGSIVILVSIMIVPPVVFRFRRSETTINVHKPATTLITDGPFKYSRNPLYVSLTLLYLGLGLAINSAWILALSLPVLLIMNLWVIRSEESHLEAVFGETYLQYKSAVRRWL